MGFQFQYVGKEFMSRADRAAFRLAQNRQADFLKRFMSRFRAAVRAIQAQITPEMILRAARSGDASEITNLDFEAEFQRLTKGTNAEEIDLISLLLGVANISGTAATEKLLRDLGLRPRGFEARFDVINPFTFPALKAHGADLIREISDGTRAAINQTLIDGFLDGDSPRVIANRLRNIIGLTQGQAGTVSRFRARMIEDGITGKALERNVAAFYRKKIALRAESIGRTEIFHAQAQGQLDAWLVAVEDGLLDAGVQRKWIANVARGAGDPLNRTDPLCRALHNAKPVGLMEPFEPEGFRKVFRPPAHPMCRCTQGLVFPEI